MKSLTRITTLSLVVVSGMAGAQAVRTEKTLSLELGREKLARKGCDVLVVNDVSQGRVFGETDNEVVILTAERSAGAGGSAREGAETPVARADKGIIADAIWDVVGPLLV